MPIEFNALMRAKIPQIVERALSLLGLSKGFDISGACHAETTHLVEFILAATLMRRPALFVEYVAWMESVMRARGAPSTWARAAIVEIREAAEEIGGPEATVLAAIADEGLARIGADHANASQPNLAATQSTSSLSKTYLELLLAMRRKECVELINRAIAEGLSLEDLYLQVLTPAMREVGRLWQDNQITVAQEHYVSAATQLVVSQLYPQLLSRPRQGKTLIAGAVESNMHEMGLRFLCDIFELRGWNAHFYGANTPSRDLLAVIRSKLPNIVALGATLSSQLVPVADFIKEMRRDSNLNRIPVIVGGAAFAHHEDLWKDIGADGYASNAVEAEALANQLTGAA